MGYGQRYNFEQYDITDGLVQSQVTAISQDKQRRLWIATLGGLSCFNGNQFTNFGKTNGLNTNFILSIEPDKKGNLMIGTERGLSIYKKDSLYNYKSVNKWVNKLFHTPSGTLYGLSGRNLFRIKGSRTDQVYITGNTTEIVTAMASDTKGRVWATLYDGRLFYLEGNKWHRKTYRKQPKNLFITDIMADRFSNDKIWLLTTEGVYIAAHGEVKRAYETIIKRATAINQDEQGNVWLGTTKGAWLISGEKKIHFNAKNGFTDNIVNQIYKDIENNIWLGTDGSGIYKFNSKNYLLFDESQGLQNSIVMGITKGPDPDEIWLGTYDGLFSYKHNQIKRIAMPAENDGARRINFLFKDSKHQIWIATVEGGLWVYKSGVFRRFDKDSRELAFNRILEDKQHNIWLSTNFGCFRLDAKTEKISQVTDEISTDILEIGNGNMILCGQNGAVLIRNNKKTTPLTFKPIAGSSILTMLKYGDAVLFGTADNGLVVWNITTGKIKQLSTKDGLFSDHIYSLSADRNGTIWMGTGRGINQLSSKDFSIIKTTSENSLVVECNQNAILDHGAHLWVGTTKGAVVFRTDKSTATVKKPFTFINSASILTQNTSGSQHHTKVYEQHELDKGIVLPYNHNSLTIGFTGIFLTSPKEVMYEYRLKGLDEKYNKPVTSNAVNYTALPPGKYTFQVKAITTSGVRSDNTASFELEITPPYYQTTLFRLFIVAIVILLIMVSVYTIITLNERQRKLRLKIKLEELFKIRKQTAEDFHDDIGNKLTRISVLSEVLDSMTDEKDQEKRIIIQKIKTNVNELYNGTKDILWSLNPQNDTLGDLLTHIKEFGSEMFAETTVRFEAYIEVDDGARNLPLEMSRNILMIFKEAVNNALKYSKGDQVVFTAKMDKNVLAIQLKDNGKGFVANAAKNGHGLNNMQVRANRIKGKLNITSNTKGTVVALSIKL